jgi:methanol dehydrogenase (cytochrome c) subunit 2
MNKTKNGVIVVGAAILMAIGTSAMAYDGTKCKESGLCWEAKPGFPDKIKGTKFDPKHSKAELDKLKPIWAWKSVMLNVLKTSKKQVNGFINLFRGQSTWLTSNFFLFKIFYHADNI